MPHLSTEQIKKYASKEYTKLRQKYIYDKYQSAWSGAVISKMSSKVHETNINGKLKLNSSFSSKKKSVGITISVDGSILFNIGETLSVQKNMEYYKNYFNSTFIIIRPNHLTDQERKEFINNCRKNEKIIRVLSF